MCTDILYFADLPKIALPLHRHHSIVVTEPVSIRTHAAAATAAMFEHMLGKSPVLHAAECCVCSLLCQTFHALPPTSLQLLPLLNPLVL